jgi:Flp pilus assembly protein TadD
MLLLRPPVAAPGNARAMAQPPSAVRTSLTSRARPGISRNVRAAAKKKGFGAGGGDQAAAAAAAANKRAPKQRQGQQQPSGLAAREDMLVRRVEALEAAAQRRDEEDDFEARLAALRAAGKAKAAAVSASPAAAGTTSPDALPPLPGPLDPMPGGGGAAGNGLYDAPPPPLTQTLLGGAAAAASSSNISDPALRDAAIGPGKGLLAAGAIALALVLFFVTGAEVAGPSRRYQGLRVSSDAGPTGAQAAALARQADELEAKLEAAQAAGAPAVSANKQQQKEADLETLEALAVTRAQLFQFDQAEPLLARLTAAKPTDPEAWRLLGEVRLLDKDEPGAVAAYSKAAALRPDDLKIATGLADAYIANGQQGKAADFVIGLRKDLAAGKLGGAGAEASGGEGGDSAPPPYRHLDDVSARLLLGKAYAAWRGHDGDAFAAYDDLIEAYPEDFRGYLAKGVLLKQRGRQSDGDRLLLQARFYAPTDELKAYVAARSGAAAKEAAPEELPDNNS